MVKYKVDKVIWISILIVVFLAFQDILGMQMFATIGGFSGEAYTKASSLYMKQFWNFAYFTIAAVALTFYFMRKDKSEAIALAVIPWILLQSGLEDIMYYMFGRFAFFGQTMPWLYKNCPFMMIVSQALGETTVTSTTLLVSAGLGVIIAYFVYKFLRKI